MATTEELQEHTVAELKEMAEKQGVDVGSHDTKDEIIKAIQAGSAGSAERQAEVTPLALQPGLTVTLPLADVSADLYGEGKCYKITFTDVVGLYSAAQPTNGNFLLDNLPAGAIIQYVRVKNTVQGVGVTTCPVQVQDALGNTYGATFDICTAVSATNLVTVQSTSANVQNFATTTALYLTVGPSTGGNLNALTAGAFTVWVRYVLIA
jgi:hypothetical protein